MIEAGHSSQIKWGNGNWIFLDIGFSNKRRSCGLLFGDNVPVCLKFGDAKRRIVEQFASADSLVNLVIEAPLSVSFDASGNPKGRSIEINDIYPTRTRYWYLGLGCAVMVAAMYLMREIHNCKTNGRMRLFEGFVSHKDRSLPSNHGDDVCLLRDVVRDPARYSESIYDAHQLKRDPTDSLSSAFGVAGLDLGVPAVIKPPAHSHSRSGP
jgi:hypothetical protein